MGNCMAPPSLSADAFARAFPFYLHLDSELMVLSVGNSLKKACPALQLGSPVTALFQVTRPRSLNSFADWRAHAGELITIKSMGAHPFTLRGSIEVGDDQSLLLLVGPVLGSIEEQQKLGLGFNDFAKHDSIGDSLLLAQTTRMSSLDAERMSQRLSARTEQMTTLLELSESGAVYFDPNGSLRQLNSALVRMFDLDRFEAFDMTLQAFDDRIASHLKFAENAQPPLSWLMNHLEDASKGMTLELVRPHHAVIHLGGASTNDGGWVFYFRDITHEDEVDRMKSEFLAAAAHELRTPMVSIFGFTELLLKRKFSEERRADMLETIHRQSGLLVKMINELLDLARIESRRGLDLSIDAHPLEQLVRNSVKGLMRSESERQVVVGDVPDVFVLIDPEKMQLAMNNLLSNAFKYSPDGGSVTLSARLADGGSQGFAVIEVTDQGIGMSQDQLARAFERFYRADASGNIPGTGLGLSMVKEVAELHKGRIELASVYGQGTTASLWLPLAKRVDDFE
jgi:signal transduction histidine kinase